MSRRDVIRVILGHQWQLVYQQFERIRHDDPAVVLTTPASMRAPFCGHGRVELVALVSLHISQAKNSTWRPPPNTMTVMCTYRWHFCNKRQRPNSTLHLFNLYKHRSVLAGSVTPVHLLPWFWKIYFVGGKRKLQVCDKVGNSILRNSLPETFLMMCRSTSAISL